MKLNSLTPVYVEFMPISLDEGKLYISLSYGTAAHLCPCGCQQKIVTPLGGNGWVLMYNGKISLSPSIGNYHLDCKSHYYIIDNDIKWIPEQYSSLLKKKRKSNKRKLKFKKVFPFVFLS